jgi:hypothetical protein
MPWQPCKIRGFLGILERILAACVSSNDGPLGIVTSDDARGPLISVADVQFGDWPIIVAGNV